MQESLLFWPAHFKSGTIYILDETSLPGRITYIKVKSVNQAVSAIRQMKTRAFGQFLVVLYSFLLVLEKNKGASAVVLLSKLQKAAEAEAKAAKTGRPPVLTQAAVMLMTQRAVFKIEKAERELGYSPRIALDEGMRLTEEWFREKGYL